MEEDGGGPSGKPGEWKTVGVARRRMALARSEIEVRVEVVWGTERMVESNNFKQLAVWLRGMGITHEGWMVPQVVTLTAATGPYKVLRFGVSDEMIAKLQEQEVSFTVKTRRAKPTIEDWLPAVGEEFKAAPRVPFFAQGLVPGQREVDMAQVVHSVWMSFTKYRIAPMIEGVEIFYGKGKCHMNVKGMMIAPNLERLEQLQGKIYVEEAGVQVEWGVVRKQMTDSEQMARHKRMRLVVGLQAGDSALLVHKALGTQGEVNV
ncbi:hypothetical protein HDU67_004984, partial [Dinochytrium kinnereticum]